MKILVTGSSGYIGARLIPHLREQGHHLTGLDRQPPAVDQVDRLVVGDLLDEGALDEAMQDIDLVVHLAAAKGDWGISDEAYFRDNLSATEVLLEAGRRRGVRDWVFYSSVAAMGPSREALDETAPLAPTIAYGASKAQAEGLFQRFVAEEPAARVTVIRPSVVFGPEHPPSTNIYRLVEALRNKRFVMIGQGRAIKTTSYVENLIAATLYLMDRPAPGVQTYIYVDEPPWDTATLIEKICTFLDCKPPGWYVPYWLAYPLASVSDLVSYGTGIDFPITAARIRKFCTSTNFDARAIRDVGFRQPVSMEDALHATVAWHLSRETADEENTFTEV